MSRFDEDDVDRYFDEQQKLLRPKEEKIEEERAAMPGMPRDGSKGNPGNVWRVREYCRLYTMEAVETMAQIMREGDVKSRLAAATALLDRAWGKPVQQMEVGGPGDFSELSDDELQAVLLASGAALKEAEELLN